MAILNGMLDGVYGFFRNIVNFISNSQLYQDYISTLPSPLNNVVFDSILVLVALFFLVRAIIKAIASSVRLSRLKKNMKNKEQPTTPTIQVVQPAPVEPADDLVHDWVKLQMLNSMKEIGIDDADELTGLPGRKSFKKEAARLEESGEAYAVIFFDANNLKKTNDGMGHAKGDLLLTTIANTIRSKCPKLYRCGGDEFNSIMPLSEFNPDVLKEVDAMLEAITAQRNDGIIYEVAHGCALSTESSNLSEALSIADKRMYEDKKIKKAARGNPEAIEVLLNPVKEEPRITGEKQELLTADDKDETPATEPSNT